MPRGKWAILSIRAETKKLLFEKCSGFQSVDDCLRALFTSELGFSSGKKISELAGGSQFTSELKNSSEPPVGQALFTGELREICDEIVYGIASLIRAHGYTFYADLLVELYRSNKARVVFNRKELLNKGIDVSLLSDITRIVFDISTGDYSDYELSVKFWLRLCFCF